MPEAVRLIGVVEDFDGAEVRVGVDYSTVTIWAPQPGGNRFADAQFVELMTLMQQAYEDEGRKTWADAEDESIAPERLQAQGLGEFDLATGRASIDDWLKD